MAFDNKTVLQAILEFCEPDANVRETCMSLSGLPLAYIFTANEKLDYLKGFVKPLNTIHIEAYKALKKGDVYDTPYLEINHLVRFGLDLGELFKENKYLQQLYLKSFQTEYLTVSFTLMDEFAYNEYVYIANEFLKVSDNKKVFSPMANAVGYYYRYFLPALGFFARGVSIQRDAGEEEVQAWLDVFNFFSTHQTKLKELGF